MELFYLQLTILACLRVAQELNRNRNRRNRFPETESGTGTAGTIFQEPKPERNRPSLLNCTETQKKKEKPFAEEPPEPKTETARTLPPPNRSRTEPNRASPMFTYSWSFFAYNFSFFAYAVGFFCLQWEKFSEDVFSTI